MSQITFNLIETTFSPCVITDGKRVEFGPLEPLAPAHEIREWRDELPLLCRRYLDVWLWPHLSVECG